MDGQKNGKFLVYINNFRGFSILLIVAVHCTYLIANSLPVSYTILESLLENSTMLFLFIGGFLFQYLINRYSYKSYLLKKFKYIIMPYLIMSVPAIVMITLRPGWQGDNWLVTPSFMEKPLYVRVILFYLTGAHLSPFWYLPMIAIFYLLFPVFRFIDSRPKLYWIIPVWLVVSLIVGRPPQNDNPFRAFVYFMPVYLSGMFTSHYFSRVMSVARKYWAVLVLLFIVFTLLSFLNHHISYLQKMATTYLLLMFFYYKRPSVVFNNIFGVLATYSFGLYFIHKYVIYAILNLFYKFSMAHFFKNGLLPFFILIAIIVGFSVLLLFPVKVLFRDKSRMLVGA